MPLSQGLGQGKQPGQPDHVPMLGQVASSVWQSWQGWDRNHHALCAPMLGSRLDRAGPGAHKPGQAPAASQSLPAVQCSSIAWHLTHAVTLATEMKAMAEEPCWPQTLQEEGTPAPSSGHDSPRAAKGKLAHQ